MKTKEQRINEMIGNVYGDTVNGKIVISFKGEIGEVNVLCRNRKQVLYVMKRYQRDEFEIMDWVKTVTISNPYEGYVKINGTWKYRKQYYEFKINKKQVQKEKQQNREQKQVIVEELELQPVDKELKWKKVEAKGRDDLEIYELVRSRKEKAAVKAKWLKENDAWIEIDGIKGMRFNWGQLTIVDDFINTKKFRSLWAMYVYVNKLKKIKAQEQQQMLTFDVQKFARRETAAEMTIDQLEELVTKMKEARDKKNCSSSVKITIDNEGTITFNQRSAYQECIGEFYKYDKQ